MSSKHITPTLQASVICEDVRQENNGMQTLVGVLNVIPAANVPVGLLKLAIWARWVGGNGQFKQTTRILGPDGTTALGEAAVEFALKDVIGQATNVNFFAGIQFKEFGTYTVEISLDGKKAIHYPFHVLQIQQQGPAPAPEA
ncbi:MAG: hypothetical protein WCH57_01615 [Verrucomicrobiota bacterium]